MRHQNDLEKNNCLYSFFLGTNSYYMYIHFVKPVLDFLGALILIPFVLLAIIVFGPIIYFTDHGSIFYNAPRAGLKCKCFKMFKLRSMYLNAPDLRNEDGSTYNADDDPRVTPIGKFLRKSSIDELPQLINVLKGDMSLVGPRPTTPEDDQDYEKITGDYKDRFKVKPGITGYAQAYFRNSISQDEKYHLDAYYANNISFILDVKILYNTFVSVLFHKNIYTN